MPSFAEMWQQTIDNDPYWQIEELLEDDPELAEYLWDEMRVTILAEKRFIALIKGAEKGEKDGVKY